jgi:hypothetical protein
MKLGIMQPYFFPYLGYFDVVNQTDRWVVFDSVKYHRRSWMNRNRILHPTKGWQYVTVPVDRSGEEGAVGHVRVQGLQQTRDRVLGQLDHYRTGRAPHYDAVRELVGRVFDDVADDRLCTLNVSSLRHSCAYLGIPLDYAVLSEMNLALPEIEHPGRWALEIASALGARTYVNPPGGREIFVPEEWESRGIGLSFTELVDFRYACGRYEYVPHLSILDVLMWNTPADVRAYLAGRTAEAVAVPR